MHRWGYWRNGGAQVSWADMKRVPQLPWVVGLVVLALAAVPGWAAWTGYRAQAERARGLLFDRSAEVVAAQLRLGTSRLLTWQNTLRMRLSNRPDDPQKTVMELFNSTAGLALPEHCRGLGYAAKEGDRVVLRWQRLGGSGGAGAAHGSPGLGTDLLADGKWGPLLHEAIGRPARPASVQYGGELLTALTVAETAPRNPRGWLVAWWDLAALSADQQMGGLVSDGVLRVQPAEAEGMAGELAGERVFTISEGGASWRVRVGPGPGFTAVFPAVSERAIAWSAGACAILLAGLAGFATHAAGLRSNLAAQREVLELKSHLLHSVSHELRTPLSVIVSSTELLETYSERLPAERRAEVLAQIRESSGQMEAMIAQVLYLGRIEARRMPVEPKAIELCSWMRGLALEITRAQQGRGEIEVKTPAACEVTLDPALLHAVLGNLLGNAVKFSPSGRVVRFSLDVSPADQRLSFTVQDEGPGIGAADLERVREPFFRSAASSGVPGTGLGLAIADKAAGLLGGELILASDERGTRATLRLPSCPPS